MITALHAKVNRSRYREGPRPEVLLVASPADFLRSAGVAIAMTAACLFAATRLLERREL